tara:strand:+ start:145 stop:585 length:441 start_codon:yes stop_codon:yes gene_type:complete
MPKVVKIGVCQENGNEIVSLNEVLVVKGQGLTGDRHLKIENDIKNQITLIEIENIIFFNKLSNTSIEPLNFRRNIVTKDIELNDLVGKKFFIGKVKVKGHDLCRPCKHLQDNLKQKNILKDMMFKGGLRCEVLNSEKIYINDEIVR